MTAVLQRLVRVASGQIRGMSNLTKTAQIRWGVIGATHRILASRAKALGFYYESTTRRGGGGVMEG